MKNNRFTKYEIKRKTPPKLIKVGLLNEYSTQDFPSHLNSDLSWHFSKELSLSSKRFIFLLVAPLILSLILAPTQIYANPEGGHVVAGSATINKTAPGRLDIVQGSDKAIIDWRGFSIQRGEHTHFQQPGASSIALNRVTGSQSSAIYGSLTANGRVILVNPNGVLFGRNSQVNVGSLIATTSNIGNDDFIAGNFIFDRVINDLNATITNRGQIEVSEGGVVILAAASVANEGLIKARLGQIVLAGTNSYTVDFNGDGLVQFDLGEQSNPQDETASNQTNNISVSNSGTIIADGGVVQMTARVANSIVDKVINMDGVIQARAVNVQGGSIILSGGETGIVSVSGTMDASGVEPGQIGGVVKVLGEKVGLFNGAEIDVSGDTGGGKSLIGGNFQGNGSETNAKRTYIAEKVVIDASAISEGDGGKVIAWSDQVTEYRGAILANAGKNGGDGGFVEVSGKQQLDFKGKVSVSSRQGNSGTVLLDPEDIFIELEGENIDPSELADNIIAFDDEDSGEGGFLDFTLSNNTLENIDGNIILQAQRDIAVNASLNLTNQSVGERVVFQAGRNISINENIETQGADIHFEADSPHSTAGAADRIGSLNIIAPVSSNGGDITLIHSQNLTIDAPVNAAGGDVHHAISVNNAAPTIQNLGFFNQILTTGTVFDGQATTAGSDGVGNGSIVLTFDANTLAVPLLLSNQFAGELQFITNNGFTLNQSLTSNQAITINADADGDSNGAVNVNAAIVTNGETLSISSGEAIFIRNNIATSGGDINLNSGSNNPGSIHLSGIQTEGGPIPTQINTSGGNITMTGEENEISDLSNGISISNTHINAEGGDISLTGIGQIDFFGQGINIDDGSVLETAGAGKLRLNGTGGTFGGIGILFRDSETTLRSENGNIEITGNGSDSINESRNNDGVSIFNGATLEATGTGDILITGIGGDGIDSQGIAIGTGSENDSSSIIRSVDGNINLTGMGMGVVDELNDFGNHGVFIFDNASVFTSGNGSITVQGQGGTNSAGIFASNVFQSQNPTRISTASETAKLTLRADTINLNAPTEVSGSGILELEPLDPSLDITVGLSDSIQDGFSEIFIGHENGTGIVTLDSVGVNFSDNTTLRSPGTGGKVMVNGAIQTNGNDLALIAGGSIQIFNNITTNGGNVDLNTNLNNPGAILLFERQSDDGSITTQINTNGGNFTANGEGNLVSEFDGISISNTHINAGGGDISLTGKGGENHGIFIENGSIIETSGIGSLKLIGKGGRDVFKGSRGRFDGAFGVLAIDQNTIIRSENGIIDITGDGGIATENQDNDDFSTFNDGVSIFNGAIVNSTGTGDIFITGTGGVGIDNQGIAVGSGPEQDSKSKIQSVDGNISLIGKAMETGDPSIFEDFANHGVFILDNASIETSGNGSIIIEGESGTNGAGIFSSNVFDSLNPINISTASNTAKLTLVADTIKLDTTQINTNGGDFTAIGVGNLVSELSDGITISNTHINAAEGNISLSGKGANEGNGNGIIIDQGSIVETSGAGAITMEGTGGNGVFGNRGVFIEGQGTQIITDTGNLTLTGLGGQNSTIDSDTNDGVSILNGGIVESQTGNITITGTGGFGRKGNQGINLGSFKDDTTVFSAIRSNGGDIELTGTGLGVSNNPSDEIIVFEPGNRSHGIAVFDNAIIETFGNGNISLVGQSENSEQGTSGIFLSICGNEPQNIPAPIITSENGTIDINGTAIGEVGSNNMGTFLALGSGIESTGTGSISIVGIGAKGNTANQGVTIRDTNTFVQTLDGNINITGTGGDDSGITSGSPNNNDGIVVFNGATVESTGLGSISFIGSAGQGELDNQGIAIGSSGAGLNSIVKTKSGNIDLLGTGSESINSNLKIFGNHGILVFDNGTIETDSGSISIEGSSGQNGKGIFAGNLFTEQLLPIRIAAASESSTITLRADQIELRSPAEISGLGIIQLEPLDASQDITVGLSNSIQDGFSEIFIGHENGSGTVTVDSDGITFTDKTTLRSPNTGGEIVVDGVIQTNGNVLTLNAGSSISFSAGIIAGDQNGGNVNINSSGTIESSGSGVIQGHDIDIIANGPISLNGVNNNRQSILGHSITINTANSLTMGGIAAREDSSANAGNVTIGNILTPSSITLSSISTRNLGIGNGGNISISTTGQFTATDFFSRATGLLVNDPNPLSNPDLASIATANGGDIDIVANEGVSTVAGIFTNSILSGDGGALTLASTNGTINTGIVDTSSISGNGGKLNIIAANDLVLNNINTSSGGAGIGGDISALTTNGNLTVNGEILSAKGNVMLSANGTASGTGADLTIAADITANNVILHATDSINQTSRSIQTDTLSVEASDDTSLLGLNSVKILAAKISGTNKSFSYRNDNNLQIGIGTINGITLNNGDLDLAVNGILEIEQQFLSGIDDLNLSATSISAKGITTNGSQNYSGDINFAENFSTNGGGFNVFGISTLTDDTTINTSGGNVQFNGQVAGSNSLTILADIGGDVVFTNDIGSLDSISVTGHSISLQDVTTTGAQNYTGSVTFNSEYTTNGSGFTVNGPSLLLSDTFVNTNGGQIAFNGEINGSNSLTLSAGNSGNILFNEDVSVFPLIDIQSANDITVLGRLLTEQMNVAYQGNFTTDSAGFLEVRALSLDSEAQSATISGTVNGATGKNAALNVQGPVGNKAFTINECTIGISCEIPAEVDPQIPKEIFPDDNSPQDPGSTASESPSLEPPTVVSISVGQRSPPSDDPTQYQFSNLGNEELWDNNPGGYSVSSFAAFTVSSPKEQEKQKAEDNNED